MTSANDPVATPEFSPLRFVRVPLIVAAIAAVAVGLCMAAVACTAWLLGLLGLGISTDTRFLMATMMISAAMVMATIFIHGCVVTYQQQRWGNDEADSDESDAEDDLDDAADDLKLWVNLGQLTALRRNDFEYAHVNEADEMDIDAPANHLGSSRKSSPNRRQRRKLRK